MSKLTGKSAKYLLVLVVISLTILACRIEPPRIVMDDTPTSVPTKIITQVITQIVVPPTPALPLVTPATPEPIEIIPTPTWDPLSAPIYYPLEDCVASRLYIGDTAIVSLVGGANALRTDINLRTDTNIFTYIEPGETL